MITIILIGFGVVVLLWVITKVIQAADKRRRDAEIRKRMDEKKEQEEKESRSPFKRS